MSKVFYGLDISRWQGIINWNALNPGASFVIIKGGGGDDGLYVDSQFTNNRDGVRSLGNSMPHGFYWFGGGTDPIAEANYFVDSICGGDNAPGLQAGEIVILDAEKGNSTNPEWCKIWLDHVANRIGFKPLIYLSSSAVNDNDWTEVANADYGLWVANWSVSTADNVPINYWKFYAIHQYSDSATFPGVSGTVDADAFFGNDITDIYKYGKPQEVVPVPVIPEPTPDPVVAPPPVITVPTPVVTTNPEPIVIPPNTTNADPIDTYAPTLKEHVWDVLIRSAKTFVAAYTAFVTAGGLNILHISSSADLKITGIATGITAIWNAIIKLYENYR